MKKGKFIDYNVILACLSHRKVILKQQADIHQKLAETLLDRRRLFEEYKTVFESQQPDIQQQPRLTIREGQLKIKHRHSSMQFNQPQKAA